MQGYLFKDNPSWCHIEEIPLLDEVNFWEAISENITYSDFRIITFFASVHEERAFLWALLGNNQTALLKIFRCVLESNSFESHTDVMPEIHLFEREIAEQFNLIPQNHPWLKPVRFEPDFLEHIKSASCGDMMYYGIKGEDIHEVAEILEDEIGCDTVLKIGRILILYKESSKKQNRKISPKVKELNR